MTNEQLVELIQQDGNDELLPILWDRVKNWLYKLCGKNWQCFSDGLELHGYSFDDLWQESYNALVFAIGQYKSDKGYKFTTYLPYAVKHTIRGLLKHNSDVLNLPGTQSLEQKLIEGDDESAVLVGDTIADERAAEAFDEIERAGEYKTLYEAIDSLPDNLREIIQERYFKGLTFCRIGELHSITTSRVQQLHSTAIELLRCGKEGEKLREMYGVNNDSPPKPLKSSGQYNVRHKGITAFKRSGTSEIEDYVLWLLSDDS